MKNYKSLSRIFILSYLASLFGGMLFGLLLIKDNGVAATFMIILSVLIYTVNGLPAYYAWMIGIINLIFVILIDVFYVLNLLKLRHNRLVELGVIKPVEEDI